MVAPAGYARPGVHILTLIRVQPSDPKGGCLPGGLEPLRLRHGAGGRAPISRGLVVELEAVTGSWPMEVARKVLDLHTGCESLSHLTYSGPADRTGGTCRIRVKFIMACVGGLVNIWVFPSVHSRS